MSKKVEKLLSYPAEKIIDHYSFSTQAVLGEGSFSKVYLGRDDNDERLIAIKVVEFSTVMDEYILGLLKNEINSMKRLDHPNIVKLFEVCITNHNIYIMTEFCKDGDLCQLLKISKIPENKALHIMREIIEGFRELSKYGIIHRDLKPANVFIHNSKFKLGDFGFAKGFATLEQALSASLVGTPLYMSPQCLQRQSYTSKTDVWSLGVIFYELLVGKTPWPAMNHIELLHAINRLQVNFPPNIAITKESKDFITKALQVREDYRLSWTDIFKNPLFYSNKGNNVRSVGGAGGVGITLTKGKRGITISSNGNSTNQDVKIADKVNLVSNVNSKQFTQNQENQAKQINYDIKQVNSKTLPPPFVGNSAQNINVQEQKILYQNIPTQPVQKQTAIPIHSNNHDPPIQRRQSKTLKSHNGWGNEAGNPNIQYLETKQDNPFISNKTSFSNSGPQKQIIPIPNYKAKQIQLPKERKESEISSNKVQIPSTQIKNEIMIQEQIIAPTQVQPKDLKTPKSIEIPDKASITTDSTKKQTIVHQNGRPRIFSFAKREDRSESVNRIDCDSNKLYTNCSVIRYAIKLLNEDYGFPSYMQEKIIFLLLKNLKSHMIHLQEFVEGNKQYFDKNQLTQLYNQILQKISIKMKQDNESYEKFFAKAESNKRVMEEILESSITSKLVKNDKISLADLSICTIEYLRQAIRHIIHSLNKFKISDTMFKSQEKHVFLVASLIDIYTICTASSNKSDWNKDQLKGNDMMNYDSLISLGKKRESGNKENEFNDVLDIYNKVKTQIYNLEI